mmetsp:Transcript_19709/g.69775  ORF Transcript_19709/g.69775 Transcript_19709/m.69775 type:complete len:355 (-) Transcript_19709:22-1086(-)
MASGAGAGAAAPGRTKPWGKDHGDYAALLGDRAFFELPKRDMKGEDITAEWARSTGFKVPVLVEEPTGLGMRMPAAEFTVEDAIADVGPATEIDVIDVGSQVNVPGWTMRDWGNYFATPQPRPCVLNVLSLEVTRTALGARIQRPKMVRDLDWATQLWPDTRARKGQRPMVRTYLIMTAAGAYTDFHIDFGGSAVWYHVLSGRKVFYFAAPTPVNLAAYERWSADPAQGETFLGDVVDRCFRVEITRGNTLFIPTGWIHAVFTPEDSLVAGGNFLHGLDLRTALRVYDIERKTGVARKFRFPFYEHLQWYAAAHYLQVVRHEAFPRLLEEARAAAAARRGGGPSTRRNGSRQEG